MLLVPLSLSPSGYGAGVGKQAVPTVITWFRPSPILKVEIFSHKELAGCWAFLTKRKNQMQFYCIDVDGEGVEIRVKGMYRA